MNPCLYLVHGVCVCVSFSLKDLGTFNCHNTTVCGDGPNDCLRTLVTALNSILS